MRRARRRCRAMWIRATASSARPTICRCSRSHARTAIDLTNRRYFLELTTTPDVIWMDLARVNLKTGAPVVILDPDNIDLSGNVSAKFTKASSPPFWATDRHRPQ